MSALTISTMPVPAMPGLRTALPRRRGCAVTAVPPRPVAQPALPARPAAAPVAPGARQLRLTRRGRLTITLTMASLLAVLGVVGAKTASASSDAPRATRQVLVLPGETLWSIAAEVDPTADRRDVIADIVRINDLSTSRVMAGQTLVVPAG